MSEQPDEERLEELRKKKMQEMQDQGGQGEAQEQTQQADAQKQAMLRKHLTDGARKRLNSVRMSKPDFAEKVERQILALAQSGRVDGKIDEEKMKELLRELKPDSKSFNIRRR
jgi:programmed cell death protein 5